MLPPEIRIVPHPRARNLKLRVEAHDIRLTVPPRCSQAQINQFLRSSEQWMLKTWQTLYDKQKFALQESYPASVCLCGLGEVHIRSREQLKPYYFDATRNILYVLQSLEKDAIKGFICEYAKQYLSEQLELISAKVGLSYTGLKVRKAKTRWGSCTQQGGIMLNAYLVLHPIDVIHYVIVHELVHTVHFNHGSLFWSLVNIHCPNYLKLRQQLKMNTLPSWISS